MDKFAIDLDKVLDELEQSEGALAERCPEVLQRPSSEPQAGRIACSSSHVYPKCDLPNHNGDHSLSAPEVTARPNDKCASSTSEPLPWSAPCAGATPADVERKPETVCNTDPSFEQKDLAGVSDQQTAVQVSQALLLEDLEPQYSNGDTWGNVVNGEVLHQDSVALLDAAVPALPSAQGGKDKLEPEIIDGQAGITSASEGPTSDTASDPASKERETSPLSEKASTADGDMVEQSSRVGDSVTAPVDASSTNATVLETVSQAVGDAPEDAGDSLTPRDICQQGLGVVEPETTSCYSLTGEATVIADAASLDEAPISFEPGADVSEQELDEMLEEEEDEDEGFLPPLSQEEQMLGKVKPFWIPDVDAPACMLCDTRFTVLKRRHHCRACGKVLCSSCCGQKTQLPCLENREGRVCLPCLTVLQRGASPCRGLFFRAFFLSCLILWHLSPLSSCQ